MSKKKKQNSDQTKRILEISLFIKNWRVNEGLTQLQFSKLANLHVNSIYNLECQKGKGTNLNTIIKCIDATGLTLSEFFDGME